MAEGGGDPFEAESSAGAHLHEEADLIPFLRSPTWLYPITRFLGHALNCEYSITCIYIHVASYQPALYLIDLDSELLMTMHVVCMQIITST